MRKVRGRVGVNVGIDLLLGEAEDWSSPADFLAGIANLVGTVLPHPGDWDTEANGEYGERARAAVADFLGFNLRAVTGVVHHLGRLDPGGVRSLLCRIQFWR